MPRAPPSAGPTHTFAWPAPAGRPPQRRFQMSTRRRGARAAVRVFRDRGLRAIAAALRRAGRALRRRGPRVEVLVADRARARSLAREVHAALRRLHRVLGPALPDAIAVVVQHV